MGLSLYIYEIVMDFNTVASAAALPCHRTIDFDNVQRLHLLTTFVAWWRVEYLCIQMEAAARFSMQKILIRSCSQSSTTNSVHMYSRLHAHNPVLLHTVDIIPFPSKQATIVLEWSDIGPLYEAAFYLRTKNDRISSITGLIKTDKMT